MRFDIEGFITFDTEEASLVNLLTGDCIELSATSARLLTTLLQYRGDIISRVDIFQTVFEKYGARPSNSNLNQYISTLRRSLSDLGIEKNVIITVPRIGFKVSDDIIVTTDSDYHPSFTLPEGTPEPPERTFIWIQRKTYTILLFFIIILILFPYYLFNKKNPTEFIVTQDKCTIYTSNDLPISEILDTIKNNELFFSNIDCSITKKLYFFKRKINDSAGLGIYKDIFILECDTKKNQCHSYYYKEIKNA